MPDTIDRSELKTKIDEDDSFILLEALPEEKYREAHLPGARNLRPDEVQDLDALAERAEELIPSKDTEVVVYCADAACSGSDMAAEGLETLGYTNVADYHEGKEDWQGAGLPTESGVPA
jgi:rhodanese-related sulfurtransferase